MRRRILLLLVALAAFAAPAWANQAATGWCQLGGQVIVTSGLQSLSTAQVSYPGCTVTVSVVGGGLATIYADNSGTPLANPFTASATTGQWIFYAANGHYSIALTGGTPIPLPQTVTYTDVLLNDPTGGAGTYINVPQTGSVGPVQIGPNWYPGTVGGLVHAPDTAPSLYQQTTGGSIAPGTWYCVPTYGNLNGETTQGPQVTVTVPAGTSTNLIGFGPNDRQFLTGAYKMRMYCGTAPGGPYYLQTPYSRVISLGTCTYAASIWLGYALGPAVTCDTSTTRHGLVDGDQITIAGNAVTGINGPQTIIAVSEPNVGNSTFTFAYSGSSTGSPGVGGTLSFYTGIEAAAGDWCYVSYGGYQCAYATIANSGTQPPATNTATIDPLQVAVNATIHYSGTSEPVCCGNVNLQLNTTYTLTTPLILGTVKLIGSGPDKTTQGGSPPSIVDSGWAQDQHIGVVMMMDSWVTLSNLGIGSVGSGSTAPAAFFAGFGICTVSCSGFHGQGVTFSAGNATAPTPAIRVDGLGLGFDWDCYSCNTILYQKLAPTIYASRSAVALFSWHGGRLNSGATALKTRGGAASRAYGLAGTPVAFDMLFDGQPAMETQTGIGFDMVNGFLQLLGNGCYACDNSSIVGTPANYVFGIDYWGQGQSSNSGLLVGPLTTLTIAGNATSAIKQVGPYTSWSLTSYGGISGQLDLGNFDNTVVVEYGGTGTGNSNCDYGGTVVSGAGKIINGGTHGPNITCINTGDGASNGYQTQNVFAGTTMLYNRGNGLNNRRYLGWNQGNNSALNFFSADPGVAASLDAYWNPKHWVWYMNDGATPLVEWDDHNANLQEINLCNPGSPVVKTINIGCPIKSSVGATFGANIQTTNNGSLTPCTSAGISSGSFPAPNSAAFPLGANQNFVTCGPADLYDQNLNLAATTTTASLSIGANNNILVGSTTLFASNAIGNTITVGRETANQETVASGNWSIVDGNHINLTVANTHSGTTTIEQGPGAANHLYGVQVFGCISPAGLAGRGAPVQFANSAGNVVFFWPCSAADTWPFGGLQFGVPLTGAQSGTFPASPNNLILKNASGSFGVIHETSAGGVDWTFADAGITASTPLANSSTISSSHFKVASPCAAAGSGANPSLVACGAAAAGFFSCATAATGGTCVISTTAVTATSLVFVQEADTAAAGTAISVTCNTSTTDIPTSRLLATVTANTSFTINLGTVTTNPACFQYFIVN